MDLLLATTNGHKIREMRALLRPLGCFDLYSLLDFPDYEPPEETGLTFEENGSIKALHAAKRFNKWTIADDSGLVVPALKGEPGVYSARYAGLGSTDKENRKKLLVAMKDLEGIERTAYFECCIVLASPKRIERVVTGTCEGTVTKEERGGNGFGYDPLFVKHDYNQTFGELDEALKNQISHRAKALQKLKQTLCQLGGSLL